MSNIDIILIVIVSLYTLMITFKIMSLKKVNNNYEILQKHQPSKNDIIDIVNQKAPSVITGEVDNWFIFDENDKIVEDKLNHKTLSENTNNLCYVMPIVKKFNISNLPQDKNTPVIKETNTKHFLVLLEGELSIYLFNPIQEQEVKNNNTIYGEGNNKKLKYMEIKLYSEQVLHIPYLWHYSYQCLSPCKILDVNSETLLTLPYTIVCNLGKK